MEQEKNFLHKSILYKLIGKLYYIKYLYSDKDKSNILEKALHYYHFIPNIFLSLKNNENKDNKIYWFKILLSYCKFIFNGIKDKYRSFLIASKIKEVISLEREQNIDNENYLNELSLMLDKYETFLKSNKKEYVAVLRTYYPELGQISI